MKRFFILIGILLYMFITSTTAVAINVKQVGLASSIVLLIIFLYEVLTRKGALPKLLLKEEYYIILILFLDSFLRLLIKDYDEIKNSFFLFVVPILVSILLKLQSQSFRRYVCLLVFFFFFAECALAIYERIFEINIFPYQEDANVFIIMQSWEFRSSAFLGHPLNNALAISIILGFIITHNYSNFFKIVCLGLGFVALLCFNARGATLVWTLLLLYYLYTIIRKAKYVFQRYFTTLVIIGFIFGAFYIILTTNLGGRLTNQDEVVDGSALARVDALNTFDYLSGKDFWLGNGANYTIIMDLLGAGGIENSYIVIIVQYGIAFGIMIMASVYFLIKKYLSVYTKEHKIILFLSFIFVGSFNNSLAGATPWIMFLLCANSFPYSKEEFDLKCEEGEGRLLLLNQ